MGPLLEPAVCRSKVFVLWDRGVFFIFTQKSFNAFVYNAYQLANISKKPVNHSEKRFLYHLQKNFSLIRWNKIVKKPGQLE